MGWHDQGDGKLFLGINVENGRIKDDGSLRIKTGLRDSEQIRDEHPIDRAARCHPL